MAVYFIWHIIILSSNIWITKDLVSASRVQKTAIASEMYSSAQPIWQLAILTVCSLGVYFFWWYYRNWRDLARFHNSTVSALPSTVIQVVPLANVFMTYLQFRAIHKIAKSHNVPTFGSPATLALGYWLLDYTKTAAQLQGLFHPHSANEVLLAVASILLFVLLLTWILVTVQDTLNALWSATQPNMPARTKLSSPELIFLAVTSPLALLVLCAPLFINCR